jgi:spermidine synthase
MRLERLSKYARGCASALWLCALSASMPAQAQVLDFQLERIVHREKSMYRNILVAEGDRYRCMTFGRRASLQTCIEKARPDQLAMAYSHAMMVGLMARPAPKRVLVIGLGGGILPMALRKMDPNVAIDVVELDPSVIDVAKSHFSFREDARLKAYANDGRVFLRRQTRRGARYDLIFVDAFDINYIPEHLITREFIGELHAALTPNGVLAANTFTSNTLAKYEAATYQSVFGRIEVVAALGDQNRIILAGRDGLPPLAVKRANGQRLAARLRSVGVDALAVLGRFRAPPDARGYEPLTDQHAPVNLLFGR